MGLYLLENKSGMQTQVTYRTQWGLIGRAWTTGRGMLVLSEIIWGGVIMVDVPANFYR